MTILPGNNIQGSTVLPVAYASLARKIIRGNAGILSATNFLFTVLVSHRRSSSSREPLSRNNRHDAAIATHETLYIMYSTGVIFQGVMHSASWRGRGGGRMVLEWMSSFSNCIEC